MGGFLKVHGSYRTIRVLCYFHSERFCNVRVKIVSANDEKSYQKWQNKYRICIAGLIMMLILL